MKLRAGGYGEWLETKVDGSLARDAAAPSHSRHESGGPQKQGSLLITRSIKSPPEYKERKSSEEEIGK